MNKEVIYKNGKVIVKDHNEEEREVTLLDNLDEILIEENVIEVIEKVISALEGESSIFKKNKLRELLYIPSPILATLVIPTLMVYLNTGSLDGIMNTRFGFMEKEKFLAIFIAAFIPVAYRISKNYYNAYNEDVRREKGRLLALYHLKQNLIIQNKKLENLRENSKSIDVVESKNYFLSMDKIDIVKDHINLYYELGYNIKEYYDYYQKHGFLPEEVLQEYNEDGVKIIEEYLKNNGAKIKKMH